MPSPPHPALTQLFVMAASKARTAIKDDRTAMRRFIQLLIAFV
jgi:hypothetical protein